MLEPKVRIRQDRPRKDEKCYVYIQIIESRKRHRINLDIYIHPEEWDEKKSRVKPNTLGADDFNHKITGALSRINHIRSAYHFNQNRLTFAKLMREYDNPGTKEDFIAWSREEIKIEFLKGSFGEATKKIHTRAFDVMEEFADSIGQDSVLFSELGPALMADLDLYMAEIQRAKGNKGTGARLKLQCSIKKFLTLAKEQGMKFSEPFPRGSGVKHIGEEPLWLTKEQLKRVLLLHRERHKNWYLMEKPTMQIALLDFLVMCFTGLRFSDALKMKREHVKNNRIVLRAKKTSNTSGNIVSITITPILRELLKDAKEWHIKNRRNRYNEPCLLPQISNQEMNRRLKRIGKIIGLSQELTSKVGRHTFATTFLENGGTIDVLQRALGHSDIRKTMVYTHLVDKRKDDQMVDAFSDFE